MTGVMGRSWAVTLAVIAVAFVTVSMWRPAIVIAQGRAIYVSPNGVAGGDGSIGNPIDLVSALSGSGPARPGDTIWLRGGTYQGAFTSSLNGTAAAPIVVRQYPGERATLDNGNAPTLPTLVVNGSWTTYWGFEIMNSNPNRFVDISGRGTGLDVYGPNTKFINLVVHDAQVGVGFWSPAVNAELYGSIIYNNGIEWTDRGHGHSIYTQNGAGTKRIIDNILFNGFSFGIHAYTQGGAIDNFVMDGNVSFNHGVLSTGGLKSDLLLGGGQVAHNAVITANHFYNSPGLGGRAADIGYGTPCDSSTIQNNAFVSDWALNFNCSNSTFSGNQVFGGISFSSGSYPSNTYYSARPTGSWVSVRPNRYEAGRAHIVIYNWARASQVAVNLAQAGLVAGDGYEIRDAQNFYGPPIATGVFNGTSADVPMTATTVALPIGPAVTPRHTGPDFGVFVVMRTSGSTAPALPSGTLSVSPTAITAGQSATLSWSTANAVSASIDQGIGTVATSGSRVVTPSANTTYTLTVTNSSGQTATTTAALTVTAPTTPPSGSAATAAFAGTDATTKGDWRGVYGADGYALAPSYISLPAYAQLTIDGASYTWSASPTETRALQLPSGTARTASTWYSTQSFGMNVNLTDALEHQIAVYLLDWDRQLRSQSVEIVDAASGAVLDRRDSASFGDGLYLIWRVKGRVVIRVTRTGGPSPVAAAVFFGGASGDPAPPSAPPTVTVSGNPTTITAGQAATLTWSSTGAATVSIDQGIGTVAASGSRTVTPGATTTYTVTAANAAGTVKASSVITVNATTPPPAGGTGSATFVAADAATQGNWRGVYGGDGYTMAPAFTALPSYAKVTIGGPAYTWSSTTSDPRALLLPSSSERIAATWYGAGAFAINVDITDGQAHQVALYSLDWDRQGRTQRIEVLDAATLAVLDSRDTGAIVDGVYLRWQVAGRVAFRITRTAGPSPVIAGVFFGDAAAAPPASAPTVTLTASPASITPGQSTTLTWSSSNAATVNISSLGAVASSGTQVITPAATTTYTATATSSSGQTVTASSTVTVTSAPPPPSGSTAVTYLGVDTATQGNWRGAKGSNGYALASGTSALPAYAQTSITAQLWTWTASTTDPRALQLPSGDIRTASTWHSASTITFDINLTDGQPHQVALYGLDWDRQLRAQTIEVIDPATGTVLHRVDSLAFGDGKYWTWRVSGRVSIRVTRTAGPSTAIGGLFFDPQ